MAFNDASVYCVDVLSSLIVWQHVEPLNPEILRTVRPQIRAVRRDRARQLVYLFSSYGEHSWMRVFDCRRHTLLFSQRAERSIEALGGGAYGATDNVVILGGRNGNIVAFDIKEANANQDHVSLSNPFRERFVNVEEEADEDDDDEDDLMGQKLLRTLARERAAEAAKLLWRPDELWRPFFHGHERGIKFIFSKGDLVFSLAEDRLLKVWLLDEVELDRRICPVGTETALLQYERVYAFDINCSGTNVITSGFCWLREWCIENARLVRQVPLTFNGDNIHGLCRLRMCCQDNFVVAEWKDKLVTVDFQTGTVAHAASKPVQWTKSSCQDLLYCVSSERSNETAAGFCFYRLRLPNLEMVQRSIEIRAPHPGIDEGILGLTINNSETVAVIHWGRHDQPWFEAWALDLHATLSDGKAVLLACIDKTEKASQRSVNSKQPLYKPMRCLATLNHDHFVLGCNGDVPVWAVHQQEAHMPFVPHLEAWLKHSLSEHLCQDDVAESSGPQKSLFVRRSSEERGLTRHPITALVVSSDGALLASGATDGTIIIWKLKEVRWFSFPYTACVQ